MIIHDEAVKKVLMESGWSEERKDEITEYIEAYKKYGYVMPEKVMEVLSAFGGLTLKIPEYRYQYYCEFTGKTFEEGIKRRMTDKDTDMEYFSEDYFK